MSKLTYEAALHAMQTGVADEMERDPTSTEPKHLRVGVNSAMCNQAALVRLLVAAGLFTEEEYGDAMTDEMNREVERYEQHLSDLFGIKITLR